MVAIIAFIGFFMIDFLGIDGINEQENKTSFSDIDNKTTREIEFNPTLKEVKRVVYEDNTEMEEFDFYDYNCVEYSYSLVNAFLEEGIYSCITEIVFIDDSAHANVVVNTSDYGLVYIEPQDDYILTEMFVGQNYCDLVEWEGCDDTWKIQDIKTCFKSFYG